jgi:DNA polymerase-3 subunit gamma/tau
MASQSLYRKWRSQTFSDLVGQEATTRTLLNAVRDGRLAHAYLFCGPRGTGKTSTARLLAKAINCANPHDGEPCNECISCREITTGRSPDVIEIDAASNTGVDNIRDLRENVNLLGSGGHYKVYVIDEVHMLSTAAFNALLKTLEEPPPHVIFVLATTEAHKVLATVVSRCQRFDFRRIRMQDIVARLRYVAEGEGLELDPAASDLLARAAQGGLRDALSLLDQAMAYCGAHIDIERTRTMLGLADPGALRGLIAAVAEQRAADTLAQLNELVVTGADLRQLQQQLGEEWRALLLARAGADVAEVMDRTADEARELGALASRFSLDELMACARVFARTETPARGLPVPQLALELALLDCLAIRRNGGAVASTAPSPATRPATSPAQPPTPRPPSNITPNTPAPAQPPVRHEPPTLRPAASQVEASNLDAVEREIETMVDAESSTDGAVPAATPVPDAFSSEAEDVPPAAEEPAWMEESMAAPRVPASMNGRAMNGTVDWLGKVQHEWAMVKKVCKQKSPSAAALLTHASPVRMEHGPEGDDTPVIVIEALHKFHFENLRTPKVREVVEWSVEQVLGAPVRLRVVLASGGSGGGSNGAGVPAAPTGPSARGPQVVAAPREPETRFSAPPPRTQASDPGTYGANGLGSNGHAHANGQHGSGARVTPSNGGAPLSKGTAPAQNGQRPAAPATPPPTAKQRQSLDDQARADAMVQELQRSLRADLVEVRPIEEAMD